VCVCVCMCERAYTQKHVVRACTWAGVCVRGGARQPLYTKSGKVQTLNPKP
jgi:hypothetical protein